MRLMILLAITTTACAFYILHPLMKSKHAKLNEIGTFTLFALPIAAVIIYMLIGSPDRASRPALFETHGPRYEYRALIRQEMDIMQALAESPNSRDIMIALGTIRLQTGRPAEAIDILNIALNSYPDDALVQQELGAAHYAAAISGLRMMAAGTENRAAIENHFKNALHYTPQDSLFRAELENNYQSFTDLK